MQKSPVSDPEQKPISVPEPKHKSKPKAEPKAEVNTETDPHPQSISEAAVAPEDQEDSDFDKEPQWDVPATDKYGDQYFAMCLAVRVRSNPASLCVRLPSIASLQQHSS